MATSLNNRPATCPAYNFLPVPLVELLLQQFGSKIPRRHMTVANGPATFKGANLSNTTAAQAQQPQPV